MVKFCKGTYVCALTSGESVVVVCQYQDIFTEMP